MHHSIWKILFVLGANEYLERLEAKLESAYSFMLKYSRMKMWIPFIFKYHVNFLNFPVLIDHDVPEENITLVSLLMAVNGVNTIAYAFKNVKIVTSEVDPSINDAFQIVPGFGNFADRYFGTEPNRI